MDDLKNLNYLLPKTKSLLLGKQKIRDFFQEKLIQQVLISNIIQYTKIIQGFIMIATAKDLRFNIAELFNVLDKKEDIIITYRGKPKAKLISFNNQEQKLKKDELFGLWKDKDLSVDDYIRDIRKGRNFAI